MHIDENGDAAGNYTILGRKLMNNNKTNETTYGLFPIGTFITTTIENKNNIPVSELINFSFKVYLQNYYATQKFIIKK